VSDRRGASIGSRWRHRQRSRGCSTRFVWRRIARFWPYARCAADARVLSATRRQSRRTSAVERVRRGGVPFLASLWGSCCLQLRSVLTMSPQCRCRTHPRMRSIPFGSVSLCVVGSPARRDRQDHLSRIDRVATVDECRTSASSVESHAVSIPLNEDVACARWTPEPASGTRSPTCRRNGDPLLMRDVVSSIEVRPI